MQKARRYSRFAVDQRAIPIAPQSMSDKAEIAKAKKTADEDSIFYRRM